MVIFYGLLFLLSSGFVFNYSVKIQRVFQLYKYYIIYFIVLLYVLKHIKKVSWELIFVFAFVGSLFAFEYVKPASVVLLALPLTYSIRISNHYVKELNKNPALCVGFWLLRSLKAKPGTEIRLRIRRLATRKRTRQTRSRRKLSVTTDTQHY